MINKEQLDSCISEKQYRTLDIPQLEGVRCEQPNIYKCKRNRLWLK